LWGAGVVVLGGWCAAVCIGWLVSVCSWLLGGVVPAVVCLLAVVPAGEGR